MALFKFASFSVLLMLVAQTSQKPHRIYIGDRENRVCKDENLRGLSAMFDNFAIPGCGIVASYSKFTGNTRPLFHYNKADKGQLYVILMYVANTRRCNRYLKYMIANVKGEELAKGYTSDGVVFANYNRPDEVQTGDKKTYRYYIYAFEQAYALEERAISTEDRCKFERNWFLDRADLKVKAGFRFKITAE